MKKGTFIFLLLLVITCCIVLPVSAVILQMTMKGTISGIDTEKNSITLADPNQYGCVYAASGSTVCSYTPMNIPSLSGKVPDPAAFSVFKTGDTVVTTSLGSAGETWIAIAKLFGSRPDQEYVTEIVGDASTIPAPLAGNYSLVLNTNPDCNSCTGTTCTAVSSSVAILSEGKQVAAKTLKPGEYLSFNGRNDGSSISVTFKNGQALSDSCPKSPKGMVGGIQPVSDYLVHVDPPIGMLVSRVQTTDTTPSRANVSAAPLTTNFPVTPVQTQKSAGLPILSIGALALCAVLVMIGRKKTL